MAMRPEAELKKQRDTDTAYYAKERWDNVARERIDVGRLAARLQAAALGEHTSSEKAIPILIHWITRHLGVPDASRVLQEQDPRGWAAMLKEVAQQISEMRMTSAEVKAAEILVDRIWPRLAQVEHRGSVDQNHRVLVLPAPIKNSSDWSKNALASDAASVVRQVPADLGVDAVALLPVPPVIGDKRGPGEV